MLAKPQETLSPEKQRELFQETIPLARTASRATYRYFINYVFSQSFLQPSGDNTFVGGDYIDSVADHLQKHPYTIDITGRDHFKSTRLYADIMWAIFTDQGNGFEAHYFSYKQDLAAYHLKKLKQMVINNPLFGGLIDHKPSSESIIDFSWSKEGRHMTVQPQGLLSFTRGIHAERIYVDDPLRDPENKLEPTSIIKINRIMVMELLPMVKKNGICRVAGTPQTKQDFFFNRDLASRFAVWITGAVVSRAKQQALWPEWMDFNELMAREKTMGSSAFAQEYNAVPAYDVDSFLDQETYYSLAREENWKFMFYDKLDNEEVVAGFDIGKKSHPSHLAVFIRTVKYDEDDNPLYSYKQIFSKWMDGWDYNDQVRYLDQAIENFNIMRVSYDNTRGEFESIGERGELPNELEPVVFGNRNKQGMATYLRTLLETGRIRFIDEERQSIQILAVNSDLNAMSTDGPMGGHGDCFWSVALAVGSEAAEKRPRIRVL